MTRRIGCPLFPGAASQSIAIWDGESIPADRLRLALDLLATGPRPRLVCCQAGQSRSASVAVAALIDRGSSWEEALERVAQGLAYQRHWISGTRFEPSSTTLMSILRCVLKSGVPDPGAVRAALQGLGVDVDSWPPGPALSTG